MIGRVIQSWGGLSGCDGASARSSARSWDPNQVNDSRVPASFRTVSALAIMILVSTLAPACKRTRQPVPVAAAPMPSAASEPLSTPQTADRLPPPQPIPPEAIPPEQEPAPAVQPPPPEQPRTPPRSRPAGPAGSTSPGPAPAQPPTPPPGRGPGGNPTPPPTVRPMLTPAQERDLHQRIDRSLRNAENDLRKMPANGGSSVKEAAQRVQSFIEQARQAAVQGDLNRARSLAERAELMASDLVKNAR